MKIPNNGIFIENTSKTFYSFKSEAEHKGGFLLQLVLGMEDQIY